MWGLKCIYIYIYFLIQKWQNEVKTFNGSWIVAPRMQSPWGKTTKKHQQMQGLHYDEKQTKDIGRHGAIYTVHT